jgi:RNA recognition motif-containing protein
VEDLHGKEFEEGVKIYVQEALPAQVRKAQLAKEQLRFKNSKKKCNLFVKNFPAEWTSENLQALFENFGQIESIKIFPVQ